jgi:hypothetical protein
MNMYIRNSDFISILERIAVSVYIGSRIDRLEESQTYDPDDTLFEDVEDALKFSAIFQTPYQAFASTSWGRMIMKALDTW